MCETLTKNSVVAEVGIFPELHERYKFDFPIGKIYLKHGEHKGVNRGFGVVHILSEHTADLSGWNLPHTADGVIAYVKLILRSGARIFSEFNAMRGFHRPTVIWSSVGTVILERQQFQGEMVYSVVTAFGRKRPLGTQIGIYQTEKTV